MRNHIQLMARIYAFLGRLSEEQLVGLSTGKLRLSISEIPADDKNDDPPDGIKKWDTVTQELESLSDREKAKEYIRSLGLKRSQLLDLLRKYSIIGEEKTNIAGLIEVLVEATVGAKLKHEALLNMKNG